MGGPRCSLRSLDLSGNMITWLPLELGNCLELRELVVDSEKMITPSTFILSLGVNPVKIYLRRLIEADESLRLGLTGMGLPVVPPEVVAMTDLVELHLDKNSLTDLPAAIVHFDSLRSLSASVNKISTLAFLLGDSRAEPWSRPRLRSLEALNLRGNSLASLPPELSRLAFLRVLHLDNNKLVALPEVSSSPRICWSVPLLALPTHWEEGGLFLPVRTRSLPLRASAVASPPSASCTSMPKCSWHSQLSHPPLALPALTPSSRSRSPAHRSPRGNILLSLSQG